MEDEQLVELASCTEDFLEFSMWTSNLEWSGTMLPFTDLGLNSDRILNILDKKAQILD